MNWSYLFKHWFGTLLISPFVFDILTMIVNTSNSMCCLFEIYPFVVLFSLIYSTPTYLVYSLIYYVLAKKKVGICFSKLILLAYTTICILITFLIFFGEREFIISISYAITSILLGIKIKLNFKNDHN
jgi:hypothetical protein